MQSRFLVASTLSDEDLLQRMQMLAADARHATADLVAHLAEVARRQAYLGQGYGSLFAYCTGALRLSEHAAYNRIEAARAARRFPVILERLSEGTVTLTTVRLLAPHLTAENHERLLAEASGLRKSALEEMLARLAPRPDVPAAIRALPRRAGTSLPNAAGRVGDAIPAASPAASPDASSAPRSEPAASPLVPLPPRMTAHDRATVEALAPERYLLKVTLPATTRDKLRVLQELFCREVPDGDPAALIDRAFDVLIAQGRRTKEAATDSPRPARPTDPRPTEPDSREVPTAVERAVRERDAGQCAFVAPSGRRCQERRFLEIHHRNPYAAGGPMTVENLALFCRPHNGHEARRFFGPLRDYVPLEAEAAATRSGTSLSSPAVPAAVSASGRPTDTPPSSQTVNSPSRPLTSTPPASPPAVGRVAEGGQEDARRGGGDTSATPQAVERPRSGRALGGWPH